MENVTVVKLGTRRVEIDGDGSCKVYVDQYNSIAYKDTSEAITNLAELIGLVTSATARHKLVAEATELMKEEN